MNGKGVSTLVGFVLLLMIGITFLATLQVYYVPSILKDTEIKHVDELTGNLVKLSENIFSGRVTSVKFDMGVRYPKYLFLQTPNPMASSISCEDLNVSLKADVDYPPIGEYNLSVAGINKTARIVLDVNNFALPDYRLIYENSVVFRYTNGKPIVVSDQKMFVGNSVNLFLINCSNFKPISTTSTIDVLLVPISVSRSYVKDLTLSFESVYPDYWNKTLSRQGFVSASLDDLSNYDKSYNISSGTVTVHLKNATLNIYYYAIFNGIGISPYGYNVSIEPWKMIKVTYRGIDTISVNVGQSVTLGVKVIDKLLSPVVGVRVYVSSSGGSVKPAVTYTDSNGEAYAVFWSDSAGDYTVTFSSSGVNSVTFRLSVTAGGGGGGNVNIDLQCPEGWYTENYLQKTVVAKVTSDGVPLPGCDVVFSANSSNVIFNPSRVTTNESGCAVTKVSQSVIGKRYYSIYAYALNSYVSHDILLNTTVPPDVHILKVYVENPMDQPLSEYQVRMVIDRSILNGMNDDGSDLRVAETLIDPYNQTQGKLPFWIESINSSSVVLWVKLNLSARENKTIFVYWSGRAVNSESNFSEVFNLFEDDFSTDPNTNGKWIVFRYSNDPNNEFWWDSTNGWVYLTKAVNSKGSFAFANVRGYPIKVEFRFRAGRGTTFWERADGMAFGFDKDVKPYETDGRCSAGGSLALMSYTQYSNGWALELDNYDNGGNDPCWGGRYIAIARTNAGDWNGGWYRPNNNYYCTYATEDYRWHTIEMTISGDYSYVKEVKLDGTTILTNVPIQKLGYGYFGIGGATGGANNNHIIDYIKVWYFKYAPQEPKVTIGEKIQ